MKRWKIHRTFGLLLICLIIAPPAAPAALLYKSYKIFQHRGLDILCDPYVVQKNDFVIKIFRQRGEIAEKDFPEFLDLFKRINPHVEDINQIVPGQQVCIPLKKLAQNTLLDQDKGVVTIPFVTISNLYELIKKYASPHTVQRGEFISKLIAREYGNYGSLIYQQGVELFRVLNPGIDDLNRIFPGQIILLPEPSLRNQPWYASLFEGSGKISTEFQSSETPLPEASPGEEIVRKEASPLVKVADILKGKLIQKGVYYFPRKGAADLRLDLSRSPLLELQEGLRILFLRDDLRGADLHLIESFWKNLKLITMPPEGSMEAVFDSVFSSLENHTQRNIAFSDRGVRVNVQSRWVIARPSESGKETRYISINLIQHPGERTSDSVVGYLEQRGIMVEDVLHHHPAKGEPLDWGAEENMAEEAIPIPPANPKTFVRNLLLSMGIRYAENVKITFPYVGIQVEASANLISSPSGKDLLIDFEELYGDALQAIAKTGLNIIQVKKEDSMQNIVEKLLTAMEETFTVDPTFYASRRPETHNTALTIPGFLVEKAGYPTKTLLASVPLDDGIVEFLKKQGVNIILIQSKKDSRRIG